MCQSISLVFTSQLGRHYLLLAIIAANQMGRTLGLYYDVAHDFCVCQRRTSCIMARFPGLTDAFSNCSFKHIQMVFTKGGVCLFQENRVYLNRSLTETRCGDGVVENLEQCDCGSMKQCYTNPCCDTDCRLTSGSACDKGTCCTNCSYAPPGTLCRSIQNICDLPEYCPGDSVSCPDDFYMQDGTPCTEEGYCFRGNCTDRTMQCMEIFGAGVQNGDEACYAINTGNFRFGHCRQKPQTNDFIPCLPQDRSCGRLQCMNVTHLPQLQEHVSFHQSMTEGSVCFGLDRHRSTETTDAGGVKTGSPCAPGKYCDDTFCRGSITELNYDCVPEKCGFRGICNNRRNCHCHVGWSPPQCLSPGAGGSADSGPPPRTVRSVRLGEQSMTYLRLIFGRIYVLIAVLLIGVATNVRSIQTTKVKKKVLPTSEKK
ncbi:disintegrin and metalloproteinase domain-containing protein 29-like [Tupaia chinensis]|uniref:disintegrin and metalloproteinase domain-containing protein 29-like n=1 Tax=Tupaia chinensis TaxID=246437 RepID=UPI0003C8E34F|nr:disintegrin and metalloproteinase domain-containing protein 29-like [Tupaia chinensis]